MSDMMFPKVNLLFILFPSSVSSANTFSVTTFKTPLWDKQPSWSSIRETKWTLIYKKSSQVVIREQETTYRAERTNAKRVPV